MKLRILSDLHIEFHPFEIPPLKTDRETVLILAGDIGVIHRKTELKSFLRQAAAQFRAVIYVLGNHEFYRGVWPDALQTLRTWHLPDNIHVLERQWVKIDDIVFLGTTFWSDFDNKDPTAMQNAEDILNDFHYISVKGAGDADEHHLTARELLDNHQASKAWLEATLASLRAKNERCVVVTHHGVSLQSIHESYRDNPLNGAFVSDCAALFEQVSPELVIHGHVHNSFDYYLSDNAGSTRVVVNPRGYTCRDDTQENPLFDPLLTVDLGAP